MFSIPFCRAAGLVLQKKTGVPAAFGTKNTFGKKKMNLKRVAKVSRGLSIFNIIHWVAGLKEQRTH